MEQIIVAILIIVFGVFVFKKMNENNQEDGSYNQFSDGPRIKHSKKIYDLMKRVGRVSANEVGPLIQKRQKIHDEVVAEVFEEEFYPTEAIDEINRRLASRADFATPIFVDCALSVRFESSMDDDC